MAGKILPFAPADGVTVYWFDVKVATTVHELVIAFVVNVLPFNMPPQVPLVDAVYPVFGVTAKVVVVPSLTIIEAGVIVPPAPVVEDVIVKVLTAKVALTVQLVVMVPVVNKLPANEPPQPVTDTI